MNWYKKANPDFRHIDPEEDWEEAEQGDQIFKQLDMRYDSTKNVSQIAVENGTTIGALASGWSKDDNYGYGKPVMVFSFDLVVKPEFQKQGVGLSLIKNAIAKYNSEKREYQEMGSKTMMRIWVVNPVLIPVLEKLGFTIESTYGNDGTGKFSSAHLIAY